MKKTNKPSYKYYYCVASHFVVVLPQAGGEMIIIQSTKRCVTLCSPVKLVDIDLADLKSGINMRTEVSSCSRGQASSQLELQDHQPSQQTSMATLRRENY